MINEDDEEEEENDDDIDRQKMKAHKRISTGTKKSLGKKNEDEFEKEIINKGSGKKT